MGKYREPQSANEAALQNLLGEQNELREPQSPVEFYLQELIEQGGGGSSLPETTSADNGKVLKVEDGEWGKGAAIAVVNVTEEFDLGSENVILDIDYDTFIEMLKTSPVYLFYEGVVNKRYYLILSYDDTTHNITLISNSSDFEGKHVLEYNVEPDLGDTKTQLSFVGYVTDRVHFELSQASQLGLGAFFQTFVSQAVSNQGQLTRHYDSNVIISESGLIVLALTEGLTPEIEFNGEIFRPTHYALNPVNASFRVSYHISIQGMIVNNTEIYGWLDLMMASFGTAAIGSFMVVQ